jgi:hypothetical protein
MDNSIRLIRTSRKTAEVSSNSGLYALEAVSAFPDQKVERPSAIYGFVDPIGGQTMRLWGFGKRVENY